MAEGNRKRDLEPRDEELRQMLQKMDAHIALPDRLRGENLLPLLEGVEQEPKQPDKKRGKTYFLSWQAFVTYAAMFAIIFAAIRAIPKAPEALQPAAGGQVEVVYQDQEDKSKALDQDSVRVEEPRVYQAPAALQDDDSEGASAPPPGGIEGELPPASPAQEQVEVTTEAADTPQAQAFGVGGGGQSYALAQWRGKDIAWRSNDPTDPDKPHIPVTLEVMDGESGEVEQQIDIPNLSRVELFLMEGDFLVVAGTGGDQVHLITYQGNSGGTLTEAYQTSLPGHIYLLQERDGVVYAAASGSSLADGWDSAVLRDSGEEGAAYLLAFSLASGEIERLSLQGVTSYVSLEGNQFVVSYIDSEQVTRTALVRYADNSLVLDNESTQ